MFVHHRASKGFRAHHRGKKELKVRLIFHKFFIMYILFIYLHISFIVVSLTLYLHFSTGDSPEMYLAKETDIAAR